VQVSTNSVDDPRAFASWIALHDALVDAVRLITPKELCFRLGITPQYLSEALHNKNSKGFRAEWIPTVISMAPLDAVVPILRALAEQRGFDLVRKRVMTEGEELAATREALKRLAPAMLTLVDKEIGR